MKLRLPALAIAGLMATLAGSLAAPTAALANFNSAPVTSVGGGAFGEQVVGLLSSGPMPSVTLPPGGGGPFNANLATFNLLGTGGSGVLQVSTTGSLGAGGFARSSASVTRLIIGSVVTIDHLSSQCEASASGLSGSVNLDNAIVAGSHLPTTVAPNTNINVPGVAKVVLNEQVQTGGLGAFGITVNAVHVTLAPGTAFQQDIIIAQSRCSVTFPPCPVATPCTIFDSQVPGNPVFNDPQATPGVELGVRFHSDIAGLVRGIRFYDGLVDGTAHTGSLWSATSHLLLATGTFPAETSPGWQQMTFATPVAITAGAIYVASYFTTSVTTPMTTTRSRQRAGTGRHSTPSTACHSPRHLRAAGTASQTGSSCTGRAASTRPTRSKTPTTGWTSSLPTPEH